MSPIKINYKPYKYQQEFHLDPSRFRCIAGGRRVGKTKMCVQELIKHSLEKPNQLAFWVAPTFRDAREVGFEEFLTHVETLAPAIANLHSTQLKVTFTNGSKIYFKGSDNPDSLRGRGLTLVIFDEAAFCKDGVWQTIVRPALSDRNGKAVLISTPNGFNWFKDIYESKVWSKYHWSTDKNPLISEEELESVKAEISEVDFNQEYLAQFITRAGRVYADFDDSNIIESFEPDMTRYDLYLGMDFGYAAPTAIAFLLVDRASPNRVIQFDEIYIERTQMEDIISLIRTKLGEYGLNVSNISMAFTDPAGNAEELSSGLSPVDMLRAADIPVTNKGSSIQAGLALVRSFIKNAKGERRYVVTKNCKETIRCFRGYQYATGTTLIVKEEALKDGIHDHIMDAIRYFFVNKFDHAKWVAKTPSQLPYTNTKQVKTTKRCSNCKRIFVSNTPKNEPPFLCKDCKES